MTHEELEKKYEQIPIEIKNLRRWVGYKIELRDGRETKVPYNAVTNSYAKSNDPETWTSFRIAIMGVEKYGFAGIGFMLGEGIFGIDLDNHADPVTGEKMNKDEFFSLTSEFINGLDSYSEYSHSGEGVHIICKGTLPLGARRRAGCPVEMYERGRFFTMTGNVINATSINERTEQIKPLWEKYLNVNNNNMSMPVVVNGNNGGITFGENVVSSRNNYAETRYFTDNDLLDKIRSSRYGPEFVSLYNGDMSAYGNDHSAADMALCKILAFWTNCNAMQIDRIFRGSSLMRDKWDQKRNATNRHGVNLNAGTYGSQTVELAIATQIDTYTPPKERETFKVEPKPNTNVIDKTTEVVEFDERNDPIITIKNIFNTHYFLNDTGNAERFYDYFGENFKYNKDNKGFMFWDGRTWTPDSKDNIRKYANRLLDVLYAEIKQTGKEYEEALQTGNDERAKELKEIGKAQMENYKKVSNKGGKDAMLSELESLHDIPIENKELDTQELLLNTMSGVVDLTTGEISAPDKRLKLSKNTQCKVSYEEPKVWLKFLHDIFGGRMNEAETQEIIDTVQMLLGEALTGRTNKDKLIILYGGGSNGKSTFLRVINEAFGDYGGTMNSDMLLQNANNSSQSSEFAMATLLGKRLVTTSETAEGKRMDEVIIKKMLGGEMVTAQFKYGQQFAFMPQFTPMMSTNNKPVIRATDFGTWRRIYFIPFLRTFTKENRDVDMPKKLLAEMPQILGWIIQGSVKAYNKHWDIPTPKCLEEALAGYKAEFDTLLAFIDARCVQFPGMTIEAAKLYKIYKEWAHDNGEYMYSESKFRLEMPKKGYKLKKDPNRGGWLYCDLKLATEKGGLIFGEEDDDE